MRLDGSGVRSEMEGRLRGDSKPRVFTSLVWCCTLASSGTLANTGGKVKDANTVSLGVLADEEDSSEVWVSDPQEERLDPPPLRSMLSKRSSSGEEGYYKGVKLNTINHLQGLA